MSKLTDVGAALAARDDIIVVNEKINTHLPNDDGYWMQTVQIIVAPKEGIYGAEELQELMMGLVPPDHSAKDDFYGGEIAMRFGKLYFDEVIGTESTVGTRTITITDPDVALPSEYKEGTVEIDLAVIGKDRLRRTWVFVYPDSTFAATALQGKDIHETRKLASSASR